MSQSGPASFPNIQGKEKMGSHSHKLEEEALPSRKVAVLINVIHSINENEEILVWAKAERTFKYEYLSSLLG